MPLRFGRVLKGEALAVPNDIRVSRIKARLEKAVSLKSL
jgi:hypothetical protein